MGKRIAYLKAIDAGGSEFILKLTFEYYCNEEHVSKVEYLAEYEMNQEIAETKE